MELVETNSDRETKDCNDSAIVEMTRSAGNYGAENRIINYDKYRDASSSALHTQHKQTQCFSSSSARVLAPAISCPNRIRDFV